MRKIFLLSLFVVLTKIYAQPVVSLVDSMIVVSENDSVMVDVLFRVENPDSNAFFLFNKDFASSTVDHAQDYIEVTSEVVSAADTIVKFQIIIREDSLTEGPEELHYD
ncbi:MAG: hypothetical protein AAFV07_17305, partial [Bacteroidota bacterium]